jgi:phosphoribosyl 1,2-cyclic phosphodiesterase
LIKIKILATGSKANAYIIKDGDKSLLIDCGLPYKELQKRSNFKLSQLDLCLISHEHLDHCRSALDLSKIGIPLLMSRGTYKAHGVKNLNYVMAESEKEMEIKGWKILPFETIHDAEEPLGFLIQSPSGYKICFATDTYYIKYKFTGVTHWMIECNYSRKLLEENQELHQSIKRRIGVSHFELSRCKYFFAAQDLSKTESIHLIHLSESNSDSDIFVKEIEKITGKPVYLS